MIGNFFNRMYNGNSNKSDYTKDDLPGNRWQLFFSMVKLNFGKLINVNLVFFIFLIPAVIWLSTNIQLIAGSIETGDQTLAWSYFAMTAYGMLPCYLVMTFGLIPMTYITRNMARDENVWIWSDFKKSIKENWKQGLVLSLLNGLFTILAIIGSRFYDIMYQDGGNMIYFIGSTAVKVIGAVWALMNFYMWPMLVTYELKIKDIVKNSFVLCLGRLPYTLFMALFTLLVPVILALSTNIWVYFVIFVLYVFLAFALNSMAINSVTNAIFDKHINSRIKGARINRGLRIEFDDDDDDEDEAGE